MAWPPKGAKEIIKRKVAKTQREQKNIHHKNGQRKLQRLQKSQRENIKI